MAACSVACQGCGPAGRSAVDGSAALSAGSSSSCCSHSCSERGSRPWRCRSIASSRTGVFTHWMLRAATAGLQLAAVSPADPAAARVSAVAAATTPAAAARIGRPAGHLGRLADAGAVHCPALRPDPVQAGGIALRRNRVASGAARHGRRPDPSPAAGRPSTVRSPRQVLAGDRSGCRRQDWRWGGWHLLGRQRCSRGPRAQRCCRSG